MKATSTEGSADSSPPPGLLCRWKTFLRKASLAKVQVSHFEVTIILKSQSLARQVSKNKVPEGFPFFFLKEQQRCSKSRLIYPTASSLDL